jgi:hypothetical protein
MRTLIFISMLLFALALAAQTKTVGPSNKVGPNAVGGVCVSTATAPSGGLYDSPSNFASWATSHSTLTANVTVITAPDCTANAATVNEDTTASTSHYAQYTLTASITAASHTFTVFSARTVGTRNTEIEVFSSNFSQSAYVGANPSTCTNSGLAATTTGTYSSPSATYTAISSLWCKITLTFTITSSDTGVVLITQLNSGASPTYTGDGVSSNAIWGVDFR